MIIIHDIETYNELCNTVQEVECSEIEIDFETTNTDVFTLVPLLLAITYDKENFVIDLLKVKDISVFLDLIKDKLFIIHNAKFEYKILKYHYKFEIKNIYDTMLVSQILCNGTDLSSSLESCLDRALQIKLNKSVRTNFINRNLNIPFTQEEYDYAIEDTKNLKELKKYQLMLGTGRELLNCFDLENKFVIVLAEMELEGININTAKWLENVELFKNEAIQQEFKAKNELKELNKFYPILDRALLDKSKEVKEQLTLFDKHEYTDKNKVIELFNINSHTQIKEIFKRCDVIIENTAEPTLNAFILNNHDHNLIRFTNCLLSIREYAKLISTYGLTFLDNISKVTGKIHGDFGQNFTTTGRLNSFAPNLQNIPNRKEIRNCFIPDNEDYIFVDVDLSGQELRIAASYSQDTILLASFNEGLDLHSKLATDSFRIINNDITAVITKKDEFRHIHKPVLFGFLYGAGKKRIAMVLNIALDVAAKVYNKLKSNLIILSKYQDKIKKEVVHNKQIRCGSYINRVRYFNLHTDKISESYEIEKEGINYPIQSTGASMLKEAAINVYNYLKDNNHTDCCIKLMVHDKHCCV